MSGDAEAILAVTRQIEDGTVDLPEIPDQAEPLTWAIMPTGYSLAYFRPTRTVVLTLAERASEEDVDACEKLADRIVEAVRSARRLRSGAP